MNAEIISIGTEILLGEITDTNAAYLASQLPPLGINLYWVSQVGDNHARIKEVLDRAWRRSDLILTTGGLGPTEDDPTREAIAELLGEEMKIDPDLEKWLRGFFDSRGMKMAENNLKQATLVPSAQAIPNARGTAPGWWVEKEGRILVAMPGPPREMRRMWEVEVLPKLRARTGGAVIFSRTLKTFGLGESTVDERLHPLLSSSNPTLGVYARPDGIQVRVTARAELPQEAERLVAEKEREVEALLGNYIWGKDNDTLEGVVGSLLRARGLSLATMESCSGGLLAATVTDVPGSSAYFKGGFITYNIDAKAAAGVAPELITRHGVVSKEVAEAMAAAARLRLGADVGVGITGVAGPDKLEEKLPGTVFIGLADASRREGVSTRLPGDRQQVKRLAAVAALSHLRRFLLSMP